MTLGQTTLAADAAAIRSEFNGGIAGNKDALISAITSFYGTIEGAGGIMAQASAGWRSQLASIIDRRFLDYDTILAELGVNTPDLATIFWRVIDQMVIDAASINASVGSLGGATAASGNAGNGAILTSLVLDGVSSPGRGMPAHKRYLGVNSELIAPDTMTLLCIADSQGGGGGRTTEGAEVFRWYGEAEYQPLGWEPEGSGEGTSVTAMNSASIITNKDFEQTGAATATGLFPGWVIDNGTAGTHVVIESTLADVYRGNKAVRFDGDGAAATIQLSQVVAINRLQARKRYCLSCRIKSSEPVAAGDLTIQFEGTGYTAATGTAEVQTVQISGTPTGGTYTLTWAGPFGSVTTAAIAHTATSATVQAALRLLAGLESVVVATSAGAPPDVTHQITFHGAYGNVAQLTSASSLTGGAPVITHATTTPGVDGERIFLPAAALPVGYSLRYFWINMPAAIPTDGTWKLVAKWTGTPTAAEKVWIDSLALAPPMWHNGHASVVVAGSTPFKFGDRFTYSAGNTEGVFQQLFRQVHGLQLPSNNAGAESILDTLAV